MVAGHFLLVSFSYFCCINFVIFKVKDTKVELNISATSTSLLYTTMIFGYNYKI